MSEERSGMSSITISDARMIANELLGRGKEMSAEKESIPLLERKRVCIPNISVSGSCLLTSDVLECLKKFQEKEPYNNFLFIHCKSCGKLPNVLFNRLYCFSCWFKECFGDVEK